MDFSRRRRVTSDLDFRLDPSIAGSSAPVASLPLCEVRLQLDFRYRWLVLVPRRLEATEIDGLEPGDLHQLIDEVALVSGALRAACAAEGFILDKLNLGALGNIVSQLHLHVVARRKGDAAWPGPVWGFGIAERFEPHALESFVSALSRGLAAAPGLPDAAAERT